MHVVKVPVFERACSCLVHVVAVVDAVRELAPKQAVARWRARARDLVRVGVRVAG